MKAYSRQTPFTLALFIILITTALQAQNPRGSLRGTVQDATGARIVSAKIVAQLSGSSLQREATAKTEASFVSMTCCRAITASP
jgi:hypothetical protein